MAGVSCADGGGVTSSAPTNPPDPAGRLRAVLGNVRPPGSPRRAVPSAPDGSLADTIWGAKAADPQLDQTEPAPDETGAEALLTDATSQPSPAQRLLRLGREHSRTIAVIMVVALVLTGTRLMAAQGHDVAQPQPSPVISPAATSTTSPTPTPPPNIRVHVFGAVTMPGVVTLPSHARVSDAIQAAGGLSDQADAAELNLAAPVPDGAQIIIGTRAEPRGELRTATAPGTQATGSSGEAASPTLDLNTATAQQLETLPGVGPVTAQAIIDWRSAHDRFTRIEELQEVDGIGPKTYARIAPLVHV